MPPSHEPIWREEVAQRVARGDYASPDDVLVAALAALRQQEQASEFDAGELDRLLADGEASFGTAGPIPADEVLRQVRERRLPQRKHGE